MPVASALPRTIQEYANESEQNLNNYSDVTGQLARRLAS